MQKTRGKEDSSPPYILNDRIIGDNAIDFHDEPEDTCRPPRYSNSLMEVSDEEDHLELNEKVMVVL